MIRAIIISGTLLCALNTEANMPMKFLKDQSSGMFSLGTRNTFSFFNDIKGETAGKGIGGQFRLQVSDRINTEWFADFITSTIFNSAVRDDYHIGWSVMYYPGKSIHFEKLLQPYIIAGHCFDNTVVFSKANKDYSRSRLSMATQAGLGTHINITPKFDFSLSGQYMLHFGKEIEVTQPEGKLLIERSDFTKPDGHLLFTISVNYKFLKLW